MSFIGVKHPVIAPLSTHTDGSEPTYGEGSVIGHLIEVNLTINRADNPLYGDDVEVESDNSITGMTLDMKLDDLSEDDQVTLLGIVKKTAGTGTSATYTYLEGDASAPYVGVGFISVRRKAGVTSYQAIWIYKMQFSKNSENYATKEAQITWNSPMITGRGLAVKVNSDDQNYFRKIRNFSAETDAVEWLDELAGIENPT